MDFFSSLPIGVSERMTELGIFAKLDPASLIASKLSAPPFICLLGDLFEKDFCWFKGLV